MRKIKKYLSPSGSLPVWQAPVGEDWQKEWKYRLTPASRSKVAGGWSSKGKVKRASESGELYTKRRIKEETKRTWRSDAADIAHGIGEGALALHPYTAIPYYGAKVGQDFLNGNLNLGTALNASIPLFHLSPQAVGLREATNVALEDAANSGSKTARNWRVAREIKLATRNKPNIEAPKPIIRTKVGDIEIDNPNLLYHLDRGNSVGAFSNQGAYVENGVLFPGVAKKEGLLGYSWWNKGKPYATSINGQPMTRLMTATKDTPGMLLVRSQNYPIGQWTGSKGFVLPSEYVNSEGVNVSGSVYNWKPGYGYKKVTQEPSTSLKFFERKPAKNNIVGASYDYRMEDPKGSMDFLKQFFALLKINGKEYTLEGLRDAANVQQGLPEYIQSYLNLNTIERAVRAMRKNGYSEREILLYIDKTNEVMNKVKVGMYSDLEYNAAGALDFGGFYNDNTNFISINKDAYLTKPTFTPNYIMKHEGRHLIDYNTSMTDDVINTLEKAYDKDFLEIPKHEDAGSLKDYLHMDRERVTTNRDAREVLLSNLEKHPGEFLNLTKFAQTSFGKNKDMIDFLNELIQYAEPEDIINAVENSNGYGKRYINYLKKNNKLTSTKIEQLRLAMIHVPSYLLPVAGGYTLYNIFNQPQLQYLRQGGKMNTLLFLKNGSGIHIKKKNRGKFTDYCGGLVTQECINKGKHSSNPAVRKRATFADNVRHFKHKEGGKAFVEGVNILDSNPKAYKYVKKKYKMHLKGGNLVINYIKAIENPNKVGWNGKVWQAPNLKGYDINLRGYGIDINTNQSAKKLTNGRPGRWITDAEASKLMNEHINYITTAANKHIKGFNKLSPQRQAALLGMLYRGDSVNKSGINYLVGDDKKFFTSIGNYYRSKGLNERANNSDKFFKRYLQLGGSIDWNSIANVGLNLLLSVSKNKQISEEAEAAKAMNKLTSKDFFDIYNLKLQEAKQLEEQLAKAVEAMTGTTINSSNIVAANNAWKNASGEYAALKNNVDLQNRAIDAQAQALKSDILGNAISGVMLLGMGMLNNYLNNKSSKTPNISFNKKVDFGNIKTDFGQFGTYSINSGYLPKQLSFDWSKVGNIK